VRVDLFVTDRPITPSGTERAAPRLSWSGVPTDGVQLQSSNHVIRSQAENPGASEITKDQPIGGGPSRKLNNIIGLGTRRVRLWNDVLTLARGRYRKPGEALVPREDHVNVQPYAAIPCSTPPPVADPRNGASPKLKTPPSEATSQYPFPSEVAAIPTTGWFRCAPPMDP
jgi:hypothetical protein